MTQIFHCKKQTNKQKARHLFSQFFLLKKQIIYNNKNWQQTMSSSHTHHHNNNHTTDVIQIPIRDNDSHIEIPSDELPNDATEVLDILKQEAAPLEVWKHVALAYYKQKRMQQFEQVLTEATSADQLQHQGSSSSTQHERINMLNMLAGFYLNRAEKEAALDEKLKQELLAKADKLLNTAQSIDKLNISTMPFVARGTVKFLP